MADPQALVAAGEEAESSSDEEPAFTPGAVQGDTMGLAKLILNGMTAERPNDLLARMGLDQPKGLKDRAMAYALTGAIRRAT